MSLDIISFVEPQSPGIASPITATTNASSKAIGTGESIRSRLSTAMKPAVEASATALANAARSPILPVPNEKDGSLSRRRATR